MSDSDSHDDNHLPSPRALTKINSQTLNSSIYNQTKTKSSSIKFDNPTTTNKKFKLPPSSGTYTNLLNQNQRQQPMSSVITGSRPTKDIHELQRSIETKLEMKPSLITGITTIKTYMATQEFNNQKLEDEIVNHQRKLNNKLSNLEELGDHEIQSLRLIEEKYNLTCKQMAIEMGEKLINLKEDISNRIERIINDNNSQLINQRNQLRDECNDFLKQIQSIKTDLNRNLIKLKEDYNKKKIIYFDQMDETIDFLKNDINHIKTTLHVKSNQGDSLSIDLNQNLKIINLNLVDKFNSIKLKNSAKQQELIELRHKINEAKTTKKLHQDFKIDKINKINFFNVEIKRINDLLTNQEFERRSLHNKLQNLKGNIRVFCRIRPVPSPSSTSTTTSNDEVNFEYPDNEFNDNANQELKISSSSNYSSNYSSNNYSSTNLSDTSYKFQFDKIFNPETQNHEIFKEISQLIQSSLDGYNVCVFAYGQTGSGKTWTMSHPDSGMIPLSINKIFDDIESLKLNHWNYEIIGQFIEIYNDSIIDLLSSSSSTSSNGNNKKIEIKHDDLNGKTTITNCNSINIISKQQAQQILNHGFQKRSTASTLLNERSSRSHSIFIIKLKGFNNKTNQSCEGVLNLIDLAGSERISVSQVKGDRLKETQSINKSLSCLGDVIHSLNQQSQQSQQQHQHIPYRNSKLTYLLKHSLGGDLKTLMFVNISPLQKNFNESINSLRFATKVNNTQLK